MQLIFGPDAGAPRRVDESELIELYRLPAPEGRGWLRTNFVMSLDGSVQGPDGRSGTINTASDHHVFALQRALADAVLVGANTVRLRVIALLILSLGSWRSGSRKLWLPTRS